MAVEGQGCPRCGGQDFHADQKFSKRKHFFHDEFFVISVTFDQVDGRHRIYDNVLRLLDKKLWFLSGKFVRISTGEFKSLTKLYFSASENGRRLKCEGDWYVEGSSKPRNLKFSIFLSGWD